MHKIILLGIFLVYSYTFISFWDIAWFVTYRFENDFYFMSTEAENNDDPLSTFLDEFINKKMQSWDMLEISRLTCFSEDLHCYQQGIEMIRWKKNLADSVVSSNKEDLVKIWLLFYVKYFLTIFLIIFWIVLILKWIVFINKNKKIYLTLFVLPVVILFFDIILFYLNLHPVFFTLGFKIFNYVIYSVLFFLLYIVADLMITKKLTQRSPIDKSKNSH